MSVYKYVADNNPMGTQRLIESFGYEITSQKDLGRSLAELVSNVGEPALKKVMDMHPDKDIILEFNATSMPTTSSCGCSSCRSKASSEKYMNVTGSEVVAEAPNSNSNAHLITTQTNLIIAGATLLILAGLILKNK
jgi:hypothetical protein